MNNTEQHLRDVWHEAQKAAEATINLPKDPSVSGSAPVIVSPPDNISPSVPSSLPRTVPDSSRTYKPFLWVISVIIIMIILAAIFLGLSKKEAQRERAANELVERQRREEEVKRREAARSLQELEALKSSGDIEKIWVDYNIFEDDLKGMIIHVRFSIKNYKDTQCNIIAFFYYDSGVRLKDFNNSYTTNDGQVAIGKSFVPLYKDTIYKDFKLFMPYKELHLTTGRYDLKFIIQLQTQSGDVIDESEYMTFTVTPQ